MRCICSWVPRSKFEYRKNDHLDYEDFVHCSHCNRKWHRICAPHLDSVFGRYVTLSFPARGVASGKVGWVMTPGRDLVAVATMGVARGVVAASQQWRPMELKGDGSRRDPISSGYQGFSRGGLGEGRDLCLVTACDDPAFLQEE